MRTVAGAGLLLLLVATPSASAQTPDEVAVELVGFLSGLPTGGLAVPPPRTAAARLEVPNEQGGPRSVFTVELTPGTAGRLPAGRAREGQLVVIDGTLARDRLRARAVGDVDVDRVAGRVALPEGILALPVASDRLVAVRLDGSPSMPLGFLLTPSTGHVVSSLRDGQPVTLVIVNGQRLVVVVETPPANR